MFDRVKIYLFSLLERVIYSIMHQIDKPLTTYVYSGWNKYLKCTRKQAEFPTVFNSELMGSLIIPTPCMSIEIGF